MVAAINELEKLVELNRDHHQITGLLISLVQAYQRRGEHHRALQTIRRISAGDDQLEIMKAHFAATSYTALGAYKDAAKLHEQVVSADGFTDLDPLIRVDILAEAGKAFSFAGDDVRSRELWEKAESLAQSIGDAEGAIRVRSNIEMIDLRHPDPRKGAEAAEKLEESMRIKEQFGDLEGVANTRCTLGLYYFRAKRYARALAYLRLDLKLTRERGDLNSLCVSLSNLANLYIELKQFSPARQLLREAFEIGTNIGDKRAQKIANHILDQIEETARTLGQASETIGPKALCACGSNLEYQDCCGRADFDPPDNFSFAVQPSDEAYKVIAEYSQEKVDPTPLDFILRSGGQSKERRSWTRMVSRDGWFEVLELPDMANNYRRCAAEMCRQAENSPDEIGAPLTAVILSACALEAFINQLSFLVVDFTASGRTWLAQLPKEIECGPIEFQRKTDLLTKWECVGRALCGPMWPIRCWNDTKTLIAIRNELVHFKSAEYEQIIPKPRIDVELMRRLPQEIVTRDVNRSWPYRLLTPSLAKWAVGTAEDSVDFFKLAYKEFRLSSSKPGTDATTRKVPLA